MPASRLWFFMVPASIYLLVAYLLALKLRQLGTVDYTEPMRVFLDKAESRLQFTPRGQRWLAGSTASMSRFGYGISYVDGHAETIQFKDDPSKDWRVGVLGGLNDWMRLTNITTHPL